MPESTSMDVARRTLAAGADAFAQAIKAQVLAGEELSAGRAGISKTLDLVCGLLALDVVAGLAVRLDLPALTGTPAPERKHASRDGKGEGSGPVASSRRTGAMLVSMRAVLDREAARLGEDGLEGKAAVDQVALIVRTLEKIDQMERLALEDQARAASQTLSPEERAELRQTVRQLIIAAAERLAAERQQDETEPTDRASVMDTESAGDEEGY
ncbi:hypothetical protein [uncultured Hoeflea sp.]|uniref:hypothetical protein n=1 Tax=uncultured Hoeflea sp. TaxID=538666 RepID=UPI00261966BB|nr:hypothetical protein [uncultured Hoeflea sp.]